CDLGRLVEAAGDDEPVAADHLLGLAEGAVHQRLASPNRSSLRSEALSPLHLALVDEAVEPDVESVDRLLDLLRRATRVPLAARQDEVFRRSSPFFHEPLIAVGRSRIIEGRPCRTR